MTAIAAAEVQVGDRIKTGGFELTVARVEPDMLGWKGLYAFIEDTPERWLKAVASGEDEIELVARQA